MLTETLTATLIAKHLATLMDLRLHLLMAKLNRRQMD
jgi:hypothetical protein